MHKLLFLIPLFIWIGGCKTLDQNHEVQLQREKYYAQRAKLFYFKGAEFSLKAPKVTKQLPDGSVVTEPVMVTTVTKSVGGEVTTVTQPVMVDFWVNNTGAKNPKTFYDILGDGMRIGAAVYLGGEAIGALEAVSSIAANKQPLVVTQTDTRTEYVTVDGNGNIGIDRD